MVLGVLIPKSTMHFQLMERQKATAPSLFNKKGIVLITSLRAMLIGIWTAGILLSSWYIVEQLTTAKVEPNFSPKLKAAMKANPKLELYGDVLLKFINDKMINVALNEPVRRRIEELTPNQWTTKAASSYVICVR